MGLNNLINYNVEASSRFLMGIVGTGPALEALARMMTLEDFQSAFPRAKVVGWVPTPGRIPDEGSFAIPPVLRHQPLFSDVASLLAARPGIRLALDCSEDGRYMESIKAAAAPEVSIAGSDAILRFCAAAEDGRLVIGGGESLRQTRSLFALLVDQMDDDILILDSSGIIIDSNRHAAESRGLTRADLVNKTCSELDVSLRVCFDEESSCPFHNARRNGAFSEHTFSQVMPNGKVRYIFAVCYPVLDPFGSPAQYLYIRRDVTEQHYMEQRLQQAEKMAAIGELSTYMAHEIRNPLFSIGGFANALLRNPSLNDLAREKARIIYDESRRLDAILTSLLNFARPTEQTMGAFAPDVVARQTMDLMTLGSDERNIHVQVVIESNLPNASGNAENLKQCLINIVKNAMEAMPDGGTVTLRAKRNNGFVEITVEDTGQGISPEMQEQVFNPFFSTKSSGSGLGLAMTRKVIEEMGGRVELESRLNVGTCVTILLPVALAVSENEPPQASLNTTPAEKNKEKPAGGGEAPPSFTVAGTLAKEPLTSKAVLMPLRPSNKHPEKE